MRRLNRRNASGALALAVSTLAAACSSHAAAGVKVKGFQADLVFGAPSSAKQATPANVLTPGEQPVSPDIAESPLLVLPSQDFSTPDANPLLAAFNNTAPSGKVVSCPDAALNAFPDQAAGFTVPDGVRPQTGSYRWKRNGDQKNAATGNVDQVIKGFEQRLIRNVKEIGSSTNAGSAGVPGATNPPGSIYQFETVQTDLQSRQVVTVWQVDTSPQSVHESPGNGVPAQGVGGPERGIVIKSITVTDNQGNTVSSFSPATGLLLLPLPVSTGETWRSVAVDSVDQLTYSYSGTSVGRDRVDACGTIVDGWQSTGTMTISGRTSATYTYTIDLATQLGGIPTLEVIKQDDSNGHEALTQSIGQEHPDAVKGS